MDPLIEHLSGYLTHERWERFQSTVAHRTRYLTVVLEDIYQSHNASAVLRTCDCLGIQDVHIVEQRNTYTLNPDVELGSAQWLTIKRYNQPGQSNISQTIQTLRKSGYHIVATCPHQDDESLMDFSLRKGKSALLFGTELKGLSNEALSMADSYLRIPMYGFTESFNISVSVAIVLNHLVTKLRNSDLPWQLTRAETDEVLLHWLRQSIKRCDLMEADYHRKNPSPSD